MTIEVIYSFFCKKTLQMGNALKKCKVALKDAFFCILNIFTHGNIPCGCHMGTENQVKHWFHLFKPDQQMDF